MRDSQGVTSLAGEHKAVSRWDVKTGQAYLVPWDGDPNFLENTAYPVSRLYRKLGELPAKQVFVVTYRPFEILFAAAIIYALLDSVLLLAQMKGERWANRRRAVR